MKKLFIILSIFLTLIALSGTFYVIFYKKTPVKPVVASKIVAPVVKKPVKDCSVTDETVIIAVNKYRSENGLNPLVDNSVLETMADYRATSQNGSLDNHEPFQPYINSHYFGDYFVSNSEIQNFMTTIPGRECDNADDRVINFKKSKPHWSALMLARYDSIGVGYVNNELVIELGDAY